MLVAPPDNPTSVSFADWLELILLFCDRESLSQAGALDLLDELPQFEEPNELFGDVDWSSASSDEEIAVRDDLRGLQKIGVSPAQQLVEDAWAEVVSRGQTVGQLFPFELVGSTLVVRRGSTVYEFLALLGARILYDIPAAVMPTAPPARLFEEVVAIAVKRMINGEAARFGWPHRAKELGSDFRKAVEVLCGWIGEDIGKHKTVSPDANDHWLDVIAWRPFGDGQPSQPVLLCQCAIGTDWSEKHVEVDRWHNDVIEFANRPQNALAFVVHMAAQKPHVVRGAANLGGVLLDRTRVAALVGDEHLGEALLQELKQWVSAYRGVLPQLGGPTGTRAHPQRRADKKTRTKPGRKSRRRRAN